MICWSGDGAIYYHLTELETARRRGIAVVLVINNNSGFGQGWPNIQRQQGNRPGDVRELVRFGPTNFADVARVFGLRGIRVEEPSQIAPALREALASDETVSSMSPPTSMPCAGTVAAGGSVTRCACFVYGTLLDSAILATRASPRVAETLPGCDAARLVP